ncbi:MAG: translation initiation factor IF-2 [Planctomycetota bacterium]
MAKEIGVVSKQLLALAREIGLNIKSHSSNLAAGEESILRIAMKQELEERAAEEAAKKAEEEAKIKAKEEAAAKKKAAKKKKVTKKKVTKKAGDKAEEEAAAATALEEGAPSADETLEGAAAVATAEEIGAEGVAARADEAEPVPIDGVADTSATAVAASAETQTSEETAVKEKPKAKIKKAPPRRPGATILGRIELKPDEARKKAAEARARDKGPVTTGDSAVASDQAKGVHARKGPAVVDSEKETAESQKVKRFIKPKQQPVFFDPEDDPLLQGIRIRHWNKQARPRRQGWKPSARGRRKLRKPEPVVHKKVAVVPPISVKDLSLIMGIKVQELLVSLMKRGVMAHINYILDEETVLQIAIDFGREVDIREAKDLEKDFLEEQETAVEAEEGELELRAPIVTLLGHVDHGKTSLLDAIRETNVVATEDGGITQHVSAYKVQTEAGHSVVFLDTPGHRAFTEMRARGADVTDIVVLVVAADDGVMPQTEEAIQHAKAAEVPIVVALNKIDKANANPMRVKQQLAGLGVMTEDWGGEVGSVEVSAVTKQGIEELLERLVLEAEIQELKCNPKQNARGVVFEARKDEEVGNVVTILQQDGTLRVRDVLLAGESMCKIRAMINDQGMPIEEAGPSTPVNVIGFETLPEAGEQFIMVEDAAKARDIADLRRERQRAARMTPGDQYAITLENLFESIEAGKVKDIRIILKADVKGTLEVLRRTLGDLTHEEVKVKLLRDGLGAISEDDVLLAVASNAVVIGFHVEPDEKAKRLADDNGIQIRTYRVIYQLIDDLRAAMEGALEPLKIEKVTGHLEIREVFKSSRLGNIAGCFVTDGIIHRSDRIRVLRAEEKVFEGELASLKRFKDDIKEVKEGFECGVKVAGFDDVQEGDVIESYEIVEEKRTLELDS